MKLLENERIGNEEYVAVNHGRARVYVKAYDISGLMMSSDRFLALGALDYVDGKHALDPDYVIMERGNLRNVAIKYGGEMYHRCDWNQQLPESMRGKRPLPG